MGLEKVKGKVLEEAKLKAKTKIESATLEAKNILKSFSAQAKEKETAFKGKLRAEADAIRNREAAAAKLESKKLILSFKKKFIDELFEFVSKKLSKLPASTRAVHLKKLLEKASSEIDVATVYCNTKDLKLIEHPQKKEAEISGGIIAESANTELRVDYSYDTLLKQLKESLMPELNKIH